jgi:L-lactate dehydrogenase complex protein LldG
MSSRQKILSKLRSAQKPFQEVAPIEDRRHMVPLSPDLTTDELLQRFTQEAQALSCYVYYLNAQDATSKIMDLIGDHQAVLSWSQEHIPLAGLHDALGSAGVTIADPKDGTVLVGISGVTSALAATGSLVVASGEGRYRTTSLLPDRHIAVMTLDQLYPDFEAWQQAQQARGYPAFRQSSNTTIITGPSKTADIAQELIKGAQGPREVHIIVLM